MFMLSRLSIFSDINYREFCFDYEKIDTEIDTIENNIKIKKKEKPRDYVKRCAESFLESKIKQKKELRYLFSLKSCIALGNRVVECILREKNIKDILMLLSGRRNTIYTCIMCCIDGIDIKLNKKRIKIITSKVKIKRLSEKEIAKLEEKFLLFLHNNKINLFTFLRDYVSFVSGSLSHLQGLPFFEIKNMITSLNSL